MVSAPCIGDGSNVENAQSSWIGVLHVHVKLSTLLSGCVLDDDFDESAEIEDIVFGQMMIQIAKKCSPKTRNLMLKICRNITEVEKR